MQKHIKIKDKEFEYALKRRRGTRSMRLAIYPDGATVVTAPKWYPVYAINRFLEEKADWIYEKLKNINLEEVRSKRKEATENYKNNRKLAKKIIQNRVEFFNHHYNFFYNRISVKNQKTCWGSCSAKKNLNFSYRVAFLPEELRDYVVVHELCHLQELNHSNKFWELVAKIVPNYKILRNKLKSINKIQ